MKTQRYYRFGFHGEYLGPVDVPYEAPMPQGCTIEQPLADIGNAWYRMGRWTYVNPLELIGESTNG